MDFEPVERCPICSSDLLQHTGVADVWRCGACSVTLRSPRPTDAAIRAHYDWGESYRRMAAHREMVAPNWRERLAIVRRYRPQGRLLDVGAADGEFLRYARDAGFEVVGTEVSATAVALAAARGIDVRPVSLVDAHLDHQSFDVVTLWHVLEHLREPGATLAEVQKLLAPGGILVVAVPNESRALARVRFGSGRFRTLAEDAARGDELHLVHFVPATLKRTLIAAGFEIAEFGVDNATVGFTWLTAAARLAQKGLSALTGWHFARAMYVVARRAE